MIRWFLVILALTTLMSCAGARANSASGTSGIRPVMMTSDIHETPVPRENTSYMWADPL